MITLVMAGQSMQETKVTLNISYINVDAGLEEEALFLCTRPDKSQATLLDGGSKRRDKKNLC